MRRCTKCKEWKPESEFYFRKDTQKLEARCKVCHRKHSTTWYTKNKERAKATFAVYKITHKEQIKMQAAAWRREHKEQTKILGAAWYKKNKERAKILSAAWNATHREQLRASSAAWRKAHPETVKAHTVLNSAIKAGDLIRPTTCPVCGKNNSMIEAHHPNYAKPLEVMWLCSSCHTKLHLQLKETMRYENTLNSSIQIVPQM